MNETEAQRVEWSFKTIIRPFRWVFWFTFPPLVIWLTFWYLPEKYEGITICESSGPRS